MKDPLETARHAELLRATAAQLRQLDLRDAELKAAADGYLSALEGLAEGYAKAAKGGQAAQALVAGAKADGLENIAGAIGTLMIKGPLVDLEREKVRAVCAAPPREDR